MRSLRCLRAAFGPRAVVRHLTSSSTLASPPTKRKHRLGQTMSLEHVSLLRIYLSSDRTSRPGLFVQRSRALALYRTICRGCSRIQDPTTRRETQGFARAEFERHRSVSDLGHIRYLLSTGKTEWDGMQRYIGSM
ncbi:uncharacterized protein B0I36DRAFT_38641 [Microdochium trichocladiopsis]|uniref:LYR motif-containing protein 2 n=1 Tax=Microdochium trichocladiopsis TaxID=1682393 RepID=A0A9P9BKC8_9PEZI|nr:uncharacterized protein B0I36DRAFT_38641 [Microdochium trichocladiopsis]KAH7018376.1 hypothetical protein B0I36DRAFT_38641 [Microdochium trichocladiopsis]